MNRRRYLFACFCFTFAIVGCGDTPSVILRDVLTTWNEFADLVATIPDDPDTAEEYAGDLIKKQLDPLKKKWEGVSKRINKLQKLEKEQRQELEEFIVSRREEAMYSVGRLASISSAEGRLASIIKKVEAKGKPTSNLRTCMTMMDTFKLTLPKDQDSAKTKSYPNTTKYAKDWGVDNADGGLRPMRPGMGGNMPPGMQMPPGMKGPPGGMQKPPGQ